MFSILVITDGKYAFLGTEGMPVLVDLLSDTVHTVRLNAIKVCNYIFSKLVSLCSWLCTVLLLTYM